MQRGRMRSGGRPPTSPAAPRLPASQVRSGAVREKHRAPGPLAQQALQRDGDVERSAVPPDREPQIARAVRLVALQTQPLLQDGAGRRAGCEEQEESAGPMKGNMDLRRRMFELEAW
jgi:hypothetical protein